MTLPTLKASRGTYAVISPRRGESYYRIPGAGVEVQNILEQEQGWPIVGQ